MSFDHAGNMSLGKPKLIKKKPAAAGDELIPSPVFAPFEPPVVELFPPVEEEIPDEESEFDESEEAGETPPEEPPEPAALIVAEDGKTIASATDTRAQRRAKARNKGKAKSNPKSKPFTPEGLE